MIYFSCLLMTEKRKRHTLSVLQNMMYSKLSFNYNLFFVPKLHKNAHFFGFFAFLCSALYSV